MSDATFQPLTQGDIADDDSAVIDSLVGTPQANPGPPPVDPDIDVRFDQEPPKITDLITATYSVLAGCSPFPIINTDAKRLSLSVEFRGVAETDSILVAGDRDILSAGPMGSNRMWHADSRSFDDYTGTLWVGLPTSDGIVTVAAVTEQP